VIEAAKAIAVRDRDSAEKNAAADAAARAAEEKFMKSAAGEKAIADAVKKAADAKISAAAAAAEDAAAKESEESEKASAKDAEDAKILTAMFGETRTVETETEIITLEAESTKTSGSLMMSNGSVGEARRSVNNLLDRSLVTAEVLMKDLLKLDAMTSLSSAGRNGRSVAVRKIHNLLDRVDSVSDLFRAQMTELDALRLDAEKRVAASEKRAVEARAAVADLYEDEDDDDEMAEHAAAVKARSSARKALKKLA